MVYHIHYRLHECGEEKGLDVIAKNKEDAYDKACYEAIPQKENEYAYSAWVVSVTYQNGRYRRFNTFEGKPY